MKKTISILMCIVMMLSFVSFAIALDIEEDTSGTKTDYVPYDRTGGGLTFLTVVDGRTCSTFPDKTIGPKIVTASSWCLTNNKDFGIAAQAFRVSPRQYLGELKLSAGQRGCWTLPAKNEEYWMDMYWCDIEDCECRNERDVGCGPSFGCAENEVLRKRDCTPDKCSWESICVPKTQSSLSLPSCKPAPLPPPVIDPPVIPPVMDARLQARYNEINIKGNQINFNFGIENLGGDMPDNWIVEMQPRPKGEQPLAFVSAQKVCDPQHSKNVHLQYGLKAGEFAEMHLDTQVEDGEYDIWAISVTKCYAEEPAGNAATLPYGRGIKIATVTVGEGEIVTPTPEKNILVFVLVGAGIGGAVGYLGGPIGVPIGVVIGGAGGFIIYLII